MKSAPSKRVAHKKVAKTTKRKVVKAAKRTMTAKAVPQDELDLDNGIIAPVVPYLEPFSDLETIRTTVEKYHKSFQLDPMATPFGGLGQIIKKHGKFQTAFFLTAALAAKEIYLIDPSTLNMVNTCFVMFSYYVVAQDSVRQNYRAFMDNINSKYQDGLMAGVAVLEAGVKHCNATLDKPAIIKEANLAFQEAHDALTEARVRVEQQTHKDAILSKLNVLHSQEMIEAKAQAEAIRSSAMEFLQANAFTEKVKADVLSEALSLVGKQTGSAAPEFKALQTVLKESLSHAEKTAVSAKKA